MAYSSYYLGQRVSNIQYQVNQITNPISGYVPINGDTSINNIKTFNTLPQCSVVPTLANELVNKTYADSLIPTPLNAVLIDGNQTLGSGVKTFVNLPQSATTPLNNDDFVNKLYVDSQTSGGLTLNQVLTNTLPYTALQTFNDAITVNGATSNFNKQLNANDGIQTNNIQATTTLSINNLGGQSTNINTALNVLGVSNFSSLITGTITNANNSTNATNATDATNATNVNVSDVGAGAGVYSVLFSSSNTGNTQMKVDSANLKYNSGTDTFVCPNFNGLASSANTVALTNLTINTSSYPIVLSGSVAGNALEGASSNLLYTPNPGLLVCPSIKTSSLNVQTLTSDTSALQINPLTTFSSCPLIPDATAGGQAMNFETTDYLIGINTQNFAYRNNLNTFTNNNNFSIYAPQTPISASANNDLTNLSTVNSLISTASSNYAKLASANTFTQLNQFSGAIPQCATANGLNLLEIANVQTVNNLVSQGGVNNATLDANPQTFTGQNIFNNYCPQSPIAPSVNNSLVNLLYLQNQLLSLKNNIPLKANYYFQPSALTQEFFININNTTQPYSWGPNDFFTIRYKLSSTYPNVIYPGANPNANFYTGYMDIYPWRIPNTLIIGTSKINIINNDINGNKAYVVNDQPNWAPNGRQIWCYNTFNAGLAPQLYLMAVNNDLLNISMKFILNNPNSGTANPPLTTGTYFCDFTIELISSGTLNALGKISTAGFTTNF